MLVALSEHSSVVVSTLLVVSNDLMVFRDKFIGDLLPLQPTSRRAYGKFKVSIFVCPLTVPEKKNLLHECKVMSSYSITSRTQGVGGITQI